MKKITLCLFLTLLGTPTIYGQIYHQKDKEGLRIFLRQAYNYHVLGLNHTDTATWHTSEEWVEKVKGLKWTDDNTNKQILDIDWTAETSTNTLRGELNTSHFKQLTALSCDNNQLTTINLTKNKKLIDLSCNNNQLKILDLTKNTWLTELGCNNNQLEKLSLPKNTTLRIVECADNRLTTLDLSKNKNISILNCENNNLQTLILTTFPQSYIQNYVNNQLTFSQLPLLSLKQLEYTPQRPIIKENVAPKSIIDISQEYQISGIITQYQWYNHEGEKIQLQSAGNGIFWVPTADIADKILTCKMTNNRFPELTLEYIINIQK